MTTKSFTDVIAWQKAHELVLLIYSMTKRFPKEETYGLTSQFRRAGVSIAANIAEGYKRRTGKEKLRFYNFAQASLEECRYYFILSKDLNYIDSLMYEERKDMIETVSRLLNAYCGSLRENEHINYKSTNSTNSH
ncbi:MAG: four helix bundle protein [Prevotellaceae bacterium]|jgi:four helix bundle protein|nr:four helix bundle protein [Prevotellaceae bacterium]